MKITVWIFQTFGYMARKNRAEKQTKRSLSEATSKCQTLHNYFATSKS